MAPEAEELDQEDGMDNEAPRYGSNGTRQPDEEEEDEEEEEDDEPRLKYAILTQSLKPVYRNGDSTSTFLVAGDKMVRCSSLVFCSTIEITNIHRLLGPTMET